MRVIKKSEVRKIIIGHVELTLIFFVQLFVMQNRDFRVSEGPFLGQKTKTSVSRRYIVSRGHQIF